MMKRRGGRGNVYEVENDGKGKKDFMSKDQQIKILKGRDFLKNC